MWKVIALDCSDADLSAVLDGQSDYRAKLLDMVGAQGYEAFGVSRAMDAAVADKMVETYWFKRAIEV